MRQLSEKAPDIKLCLSTNGLALLEMVDEICKHNIDHVTITINMVDPETAPRFIPDLLGPPAVTASRLPVSRTSSR